MNNGEQPVFPHTENKLGVGGRGMIQTYFPGMTLRQYYAGLAMQGILARRFDEPIEDVESTAKDAVEYADALLSQLEPTKQK